MESSEYKFEIDGKGRFLINGRQVSREEFYKTFDVEPKRGLCYLDGIRVTPEELMDNSRDGE